KPRLPGHSAYTPVFFAGCRRTVRRARRVRGGHGVLLTAFTALLVCPVSWTHHWVWCVPLLAVLRAEGRTRTAVLVALVFTARTMWLVPHHGSLDLELPWWQQPLAAPYALLPFLLPFLLPPGAARAACPVAPSPPPGSRPRP
ncbi:hypothetical protein ABZ299_13375, partial [Streptomyces sp. NPDC006184]